MNRQTISGGGGDSTLASKRTNKWKRPPKSKQKKIKEIKVEGKEIKIDNSGI